MFKFNKIFKNVKTNTVKEYFDLPKIKRQKYGIYLKPYALPADFINNEEIGWNAWTKQIRKEYPIQGWIREWFFSFDNPVYAFIKLKIIKLINFKYNIKRFFKPCSPRFFKCWRRWEYMDKVEAIRIVNFAMLQDFWHDEVKNQSVNWSFTEEHKDFYNWISSAIIWIESERLICENRMNEGYNIANSLKKQPYEIQYAEVNRWEKIIQEKDSETLTNMIKYREFFWT